MRYDDWPDRLRDYLDATRPHDWASGNDCVQWAGGAVEEMTGKNPFAHLAGYQTEDEARDILEAQYDGSLAMLLDAHLDRIPKRLAGRGDLVLGPWGPRAETVVGVCGGAECYALGFDGLIAKPTCEAEAAWRVR